MPKPEYPGRAPLSEDLKVRMRKMTVEGTTPPEGGAAVLDEANVVPPVDLVRAHELATERETGEVVVGDVLRIAEGLEQRMKGVLVHVAQEVDGTLRAALEIEAGSPLPEKLSVEDAERVRNYLALQMPVSQPRAMAVGEYLLIGALHAAAGERVKPWEWTSPYIQFEQGPPGTNFRVRPVVQIEIDTGSGSLEKDDSGGSSLDEPTADARAARREDASIARDERFGGTIPDDNPPENR